MNRRDAAEAAAYARGFEKVTQEQWEACWRELHDPVARASARRAYQAEIDSRRRQAVDAGRRAHRAERVMLALERAGAWGDHG